MSDEQNEKSGNRWEPGEQGEGPAEPVQAPAPAAVPEPTGGSPRPALRDRINRTQAGLVGAGALLLLGGGVGGYFVGHATGSDDHGRDFPGVRGPDGFRDGRAFGGDGDGRGQLVPPNGQFNGSNGQDQPNGQDDGAPGTGQDDG
jgi:hypothetical protein